LSPQGETAIAEVAPFVRTINDLLFKDISPEELETAKKVARTVFRNSDYVLVELRRRNRKAEVSRRPGPAAVD
jgi:DNA-binding MarR family transcriptional regulator